MKILIPCAAPIEYNPAYYLENAFIELGHFAMVVDQSAYYSIHEMDEIDLIVGVDSGGPLNLMADKYGHKTAMWFIDSRRNHKPEIRTPDDDTTAINLLRNGGVVFQAQRADVHRLSSKIIDHRFYINYLPLAADPEVWFNQPDKEPEHLAAFVGNCYDPVRLSLLESLSNQGLVYWPGIEGAIMQEGALVYNNAKVGLNIPSFYGTPECYDVNMRVFEIMSCGRPLLTNDLPDLHLLGISKGVHCMTYEYLNQVPDLIEDMSQSGKWQLMGEQARKLILKHHTYKHRAEQILKVMKSHGKVED